MGATKIPIVDISPLLPGSGSKDSAAAQTAIEHLMKSCHEQGCVGISGHGIPHDKLSEAFSYIQKLFALPMEDKMKAPHPEGWTPHRGYSAPGREKAYTKEDMEEMSEEKRKAARQIVDYKESFEVGSEENKEDYNIWLPEEVLPGFRGFSTELYWELHKLCMLILDAFCTGLGLTDEERKRVLELHTGHNNQLRHLHYPPIEETKVDSDLIGRMPAHTDINTFTLLFQDSCEGLEFEDRTHEGQFINAEPQGDTLYLNVADTLTHLSNDYLPAANHRVSIPKGLVNLPGKEGRFTPPRYSMPYFFATGMDAFIEPLSTCVKATTGKPEYKGMTLKEYVMWRVQWIYAK